MKARLVDDALLGLANLLKILSSLIHGMSVAVTATIRKTVVNRVFLFFRAELIGSAGAHIIMRHKQLKIDLSSGSRLC